MDADRFARIEALFETALELEPEARDEFLRAECAGDDDLRRQVERLLEHDDEDRTMHLDLTARPMPALGARVGPYKLIQLLGEGGFGDVYLADQSTPVSRRVALKVVKPGMDSRQVIARFEAERQALAMMDHPNIARVLDAGTTDAALGSRPYFAMELVRGLPITEHCDEHGLTVDQRLDLIMAVCDAVQHAHQKGVIHRDIKPSNVLVAVTDRGPVPKVIDFGIAKAMYHRLTERTLVTEVNQFVGTPAYMSPEQAAGGLDVDTRSDIYSIGVVLYELLTGTTPVDSDTLRGVPPGRLPDLLRDARPEKPSTRISALGAEGSEVARRRRIGPRQLNDRLRGDLDWIVMKALEPDRSRRYQTALALAADLDRSRRDEPVSAGPPGPVYVVRKFVRRHRASVMAASLILLALLVAVAGTTWGMLRARSAAAEAQALNAFLRDVLTSVDPDVDGPGVTLADVMVRASDGAATRFAGYPAREAEIRALLGEVFTELSRHREAVPHLRAALAFFDAEGYDELDPRRLELTFMFIDELAAMRELDESNRRSDALIGLLTERRGAEHPLTQRARLQRAASRLDRGEAGAEAEIRGLLALAQRSGADARDLERDARAMLGHALFRRLNVSAVPSERERVSAELLDVVAQILEDEPPNGSRAIDARRHRAWAWFYEGAFADAEAEIRAVYELSVRRWGPRHGVTLGLVHLLAIALERQGRAEDAVEWVVLNVESNLESSGPAHPVTLSAIVDGLPALVEANATARGFEYVNLAMEQFLRFDRPDGPFVTELRSFLAWLHLRAGDLEEADRELERVRAALPGITHMDLGPRVEFIAGELARARGDDAAAERHFIAAIEAELGKTDVARLALLPRAARALATLYDETGREADGQAVRESEWPWR